MSLYIESKDKTIRNNADTLNIIPKFEWSGSNISYAIMIAFCSVLAIFSIYMYFDSHKQYISTVATITNVDCNKFRINNDRNEYHCVTGITYSPFGPDKKYDNSLMFVDSETFNVGDKINILVDRYNPLNIKIQVVSDQVKAVILFFSAIILLIISSSIRFIKLE